MNLPPESPVKSELASEIKPSVLVLVSWVNGAGEHIDIAYYSYSAGAWFIRDNFIDSQWVIEWWPMPLEGTGEKV